ncbi:hypothetical protein [Bdellovibrio sp. NC01]|uniref:hypothetical protein n=1 Tax=Bdellovibrio sp. NC01 TaxID=2220073 RepID=UPI001158997F|nr:hypothetical protein [Bdellovibrio sp. NC01]QDK37582.1 hypothetical protein DOE51_08280 [Bdellovibrio sp. NC01]
MRSALWIILTWSLASCGFSAAPVSSLSDPQTSTAQTVTVSNDNFTVAYDGEGSVSIDSQAITLSPKVATVANETHAALVFLNDTLNKPVRDFELTIELETVRQLRKNTAANPWEVFWLFFSYNQNNVNDKTTNYFLSKPQNGGELGLAFDSVGQTFLSDLAPAKTAIGERHIFTYRRKGNLFTVVCDGVSFFSFADSSKLYSAKGAIGFYTEDALVKIYSVRYANLD